MVEYGQMERSIISDTGRIQAVLIEKMRGTDFDEQMRPLRISRGGMYVADKDSLISYP